jgi:2-polyprenyl-6-methoxyphenol hydroxylase-like FAD-dependent oxidoreductase
MGSIVVCGGSVIGLSTAVLLARDGHRVTVLESNPEPPPAEPADAWTGWQRSGVAQFRQPHTMFPGFREVLRRNLPDLIDRLEKAGCASRSFLDSLPPGITDRDPRPGDERLQGISGRRPVVEAVFAAAAEVEPGVTVRRGVRAVGLVNGDPVLPSRPGIPHVVGVRTDDGGQLRADLVVDAMGRRTPSAHWLEWLGARPAPVTGGQSGFVYYSRYFAGADLPHLRAAPLSPIGSFSLLTIPADNDTWSVTVFAASGDAPLKALRDPVRFTRLLRACPAHAHWLDGTPLTEVLPIGGILDRHRRFVLDDEPVVTGFAAVGDAWACTNPSAGRGLSVGLIHAELLRDVVRDRPSDPVAFQLDWDQRTERRLTPFYQGQLDADRVRIAEMAALRDGVEPAAPDPMTLRLQRTAGHDGDVFRALMEIVGCLAHPDEVFRRPGFVASLDDLDDLDPPNRARAGGRSQPPGPDREQLLQLLA